MPFLGQDWRSPGENWVKTSDGWEKLKMWRFKVLEGLNRNFLKRLQVPSPTSRRRNLSGDFTDVRPIQPHIFIAKGISRESLIMHSVSEVFSKLDISGSVKNIKRFNYVCKVVHFMISYLASLSGSAQRYLFEVLHEILKQSIETGNHLSVVQSLVADLVHSLEVNEHSHIGSSVRWRKQLENARDMKRQLDEARVILKAPSCDNDGNDRNEEKQEDDDLSFSLSASSSHSSLDLAFADELWSLSDLPDDCIRLILYCLNDGLDIQSLVDACPSRIYGLSQESLLWRRLVFFHFTPDQVHSISTVTKGLAVDENRWQNIYVRLAKRYGLREIYTDPLHVCSKCGCVFWKSTGHPCLNKDESNPASQEIPPLKFVKICIGE